MKKFNDRQIKFIDDLLLKTSKGDVNYSILDYNEYNKTFTFLNKPPYNLFDTDGNNIWLSQLGNEIINDFNGSFKSYLESIKTEQELDKSIKQLTLSDLQKTDKRSKISFCLSIIAIVVALFLGVLDYTKPEKSQDNTTQNTNNTKNNTNIGSEVNHPKNPSNFIDTTSIKINSDFSKH